MRLLLLLLSLWLRPALSHDLSDQHGSLASALEFQLFAVRDVNEAFVLQQETSPEDELSQQTPNDSSLFTDFISNDIQQWDDNDVELSDRGVLVRQTRRCPPGTYMCSNGRCCPSGQNCVPGGCCPSGNSQCGSGGCYNPGAGQVCCGGAGRHCPGGYDCVQNGCCRKGTKPCGNGCYDPKTQVCCGQTGGSCPKSSVCVTGGCCPKGTKKCGTGRCYDPNTQVCCGEPGTTCRKTETCVPGGCCPKGQSKCGSTKCYDKKTETCCEAGSCDAKKRAAGSCSLDTVCPRDKTCVDGNRCCPKGQELCGENSCYDPKTQKCCDDAGGHACPKDYDCMKTGGCCPEGQIKCGTNKCYDPKKTSCCRNSSGTLNWGCSSGSQCCVASTGCFNARTERCCKNGPCHIDGACCNGICCAPGEMCNRLKQCVKRQQSSSTKTRTCTTPTATRAAPTPMVTIPFVYDPKRSIRKSADPNSDEVFDVSNMAVLMNMCRGMKKLNGGRATQKTKLTYAGKGEKNCWQKWNRKIMCPKIKGKNYCANAISEYVDQFFPDGAPSWAKAAIQEAGDMSCDEFPFANTLQGGDAVNGVVICLPSDDNSFQGGSMGKYFKKIGGYQAIEAGEDYVIDIQGWDCSKDEPMRKRSDVGLEHFILNVFEDTAGAFTWEMPGKRDSFSGPVERYGEGMYHGFDAKNSKLNLMTMPLGDLTAGKYLVNLDVKKGNLSYTVVDYVGNSFAATTLSNGSIEFTLDDEWTQVSLTGTTEEEEVELSYEAETISRAAQASLTTGVEAPEPTESDDAGSMVRVSTCTEGIVLICALLLVFM